MKKWIVFILSLICVYSFAGCAAAGVKPYRDLQAHEIASASVCVTPPDQTVQIVEFEELAEYLNDVVIYEKDASYTEYDGQGVTFTLILTDGTKTTIMAYNPFLVVDGVGYRTEYEPCAALNGYANKLVNREDAPVILEEPPALTVICKEEKTEFDALLGAYSWQRINQDGTAAATEADSAHPLDCQGSLLFMETAGETVTLSFTKAPDAILSIQCWSDAHWSDPTANSEPVEIHGDTIELKSGGYIYEIIAQWDAENGYGGTAHYSFYMKTE